MEKGRVKWFNLDKGFGFIERPGLPDLFIHIGDRQVRAFKPNASGEPKVLSTGKPWKPTEERNPRRQGGDWVLYEIGQSRDSKPKAAPWEFADEYDQARYESQVLAGQPKQQMPFEAAVKFLASSDFWRLVDHAFGDEEFGWTRDDQKVACGYYSRGRYEVWTDETKFYLTTEFKGAMAERLHNGDGKTRKVERNDSGDPREW